MFNQYSIEVGLSIQTKEMKNWWALSNSFGKMTGKKTLFKLPLSQHAGLKAQIQLRRYAQFRRCVQFNIQIQAKSHVQKTIQIQSTNLGDMFNWGDQFSKETSWIKEPALSPCAVFSNPSCHVKEAKFHLSQTLQLSICYWPLRIYNINLQLCRKKQTAVKLRYTNPKTKVEE